MTSDVTASCRDLRCWFGSPLGRSLHAIEVGALRSVLSGLPAVTAVQVGAPGGRRWLEGVTAPRRVLADPALTPQDIRPSADGGAILHSHAEALAIASRSVDLVLLPHTLDFSDDPHEVLREVERILAPEGHLIVLGFNPVSLWGLWRMARRRRGLPWSAQFLALSRVKDWMRLLNMTPAQGRMLYYRPPLASDRARDRLRFLESMGDRWWPLAGGVYLVMAKKRLAGLTPLRPRWARRPARAVAAQPVARIARHG